MDTDRFRVRPGQKVDLRRYDPADTAPFTNKQKTAERLERSRQRMIALQEVLYANNRWSVLLIFQAMDAAGKDSGIKHVMSGLNPQGTQVFTFKRPSDEELDHDYLWRTTRALPERGRIGIFNRSYYEEVLVVRVHPEILDSQRLPRALVTPHIWRDRFEDISAFERYLGRNGTHILKFFLHVSKAEQRRRLLARLDEPSKNWKFEVADLGERDLWGRYMHAYEQALSATSTKHAPWFIVPADNKWFMRLVISDLVVKALEGLALTYPKVSKAHLAELAEARQRLEKEEVMFGKQPSPRERFTPPDWSGEVTTHLEKLREYAEEKIQDELTWYYRKKKGRSWTSRGLRFSAVVLSVLGGLVPLLISIFGERPSWEWLSPFESVRFGQLGYLFLAMAGGLFVLDKYFGYSTGWMRYIVAMQTIEKAREVFRLDWAVLSRALSNTSVGTPKYEEAVERMLQRVRSAIVEVKEHSEKETQAWILEFQTNLAQFEKDLKSQMEAGRPGGIDVEVTDGRNADAEIELSLDGMIADRFSGTVGSIGYVAPGLHRVTAKAQKANRDYAASAMVNVGGGQICQVKLTLNLPP